MTNHADSDSLRVIRAAFCANVAIAVCKRSAAYLSGSAATLTEAVQDEVAS